jgi:hypothetical protein
VRFYCIVEICDENDRSVCYNRLGQNLKIDGLCPSQMASEPVLLDPFLSPRLCVCSSVNLYRILIMKIRPGAGRVASALCVHMKQYKEYHKHVGTRVECKRALLELAPPDFERL